MHNITKEKQLPFPNYIFSSITIFVSILSSFCTIYVLFLTVTQSENSGMGIKRHLLLIYLLAMLERCGTRCGIT